MATCNIPNFNFDFQIQYDISSGTPTVLLTNQSTGANLANVDFWFELFTPNGTLYHAGSSTSPDATGAWLTFLVPENIPQAEGHVEFSNAQPYKIIAYAKDNLDNICTITKEDYITKPTGNNGTDNYGGMSLNVTQKCQIGRLQLIDTTNYLYQGLTGAFQSNETIFVYPPDDTGAQIANFVVDDQFSFTIPIPINGKGHALIRTGFYIYTLATGTTVVVKYKYKKDCIEINCNVNLCSLMCGLKKYREALTDSNGQCNQVNATKLALLNLKIAELIFATNQPLCGYDICALYTEIRAELSKNNCLCDDCNNTGNNDVTGLKCDDIDIACVWNNIYILLKNNTDEKDKFCELVEECINASGGGCSTPFISGVLFTPTTITVNFQLANQTNSNSLEVFYKLHSSGVWISAAVLASTASTYDIVGVFTVGESYDVKVVNNCTAGTADSAIVTGIIPDTLNACYYLDLIYGGLGDGVYAIKVDTGETGCAKYTYELIDGTFVQSLMGCIAPINVAVDENGVVTWNGVAGDYEVSYKLKTTGVWTVFSTLTYAGIAHTEDVSGALVDPVADYDFRVRKFCTPDFSLPVYTDYLDLSQFTKCPGAGDFISFNETTGELSWSGNGNALANYTVVAYVGGLPNSPVGVIVSGTGLILTIDFANILAGISPGDTVIFSVQQDCGSGSVSDISTYAYLVTGVAVACPSFIPLIDTTIENNTILVNPTLVVPDAAISQTQYEIGIQFQGVGPWVTAGTGMLVLDGAYQTTIQSLIPINVGDAIRMRFKSFCGCCTSSTTDSGWSAWSAGFVVTGIVNDWDDVWKAIPGGWYLNGATAAGGGAFYKIDSNGNFHLRGEINTNNAVPAGYDLKNTDFLDITAIYSLLNPNTLSTADTDWFAMSLSAPATTISATEMLLGHAIYRVDNIFTYVYATLSTAGYANTPQFGISHLRII